MDDSRTIARSDPHPSHAADPGQLAPGEQVGRYVITCLIGAGGMGAVYEARDPLLDRKLAVKVLRSGEWTAADDDARARLLREAQALARLTHPHVVAVHDVGRIGDGVFIAMDLLDGGTVLHWLQSARRGWRDILDLYLRAGAGLAAAHDSGLVHRDFKPANVLLGKDGRVCVSDFGLVRLPSSPAGAQEHVDTMDRDLDQAFDSNALTRQGTVVGSPGYMAPEQMIGESIGAAADVFSFCVSLYEALFEEPPYPGRTLTDICRAIMLGPPPSPPADVVPAWLEALVVRGLAARPEARPTMRALLDELERERQEHVLARADRLLEEAGMLARAGGGDAEFIRVAARLLRDFVQQSTPGAERRLDTPGPAVAVKSRAAAPASHLDEDEVDADAPILAKVEMSGAHAQALLAKLGFQALASHFMLREGLGVLQPDGTTAFDAQAWYPAVPFVRAAHNLVNELGPRATFKSGLFSRADAGGGFEMAAAMAMLDRTYHRNFRLAGRPLVDAHGQALPGIGRYLSEPAGPRAVTVTATGPWPCELDNSVITGIALRIEADAVVEHGAGDPCRKQGARRCVYHVRWGASAAIASAHQRLRRASSPEELLAAPDGCYLMGETFIYWHADADLDGTIFRGRPSADELRMLIDLWDQLRLRHPVKASVIDLRRVTEIPPDTFYVFEGYIRARREEMANSLRGLAVLRPSAMPGALVTGVFQMQAVLHPLAFFNDEAAALAWVGREDPELAAELRVLAAIRG